MMLPDTSAQSDTSFVLQRLKAATRAEHEAIEALLDLMSPGFSLADYHRRLQRYYGFYAPVEALIAAAADWPHWRLDMRARTKTAWLVADLACLADQVEPGELRGAVSRALPLCTALPPLDTAAAAFGCVYVLEGATLGGRVISRHLERVLGLNATRGARFFHGYGEQTGAMWKGFRAALSAFAGNPADEDEIVASAISTFEALRAWCAADEPQHAAATGGAVHIRRWPVQGTGQ